MCGKLIKNSKSLKINLCVLKEQHKVGNTADDIILTPLDKSQQKHIT